MTLFPQIPGTVYSSTDLSVSVQNISLLSNQERDYTVLNSTSLWGNCLWVTWSVTF